MEFKICRVCLDRTATISVFRKQKDIQYSVKIMRCVNVVIAEGDGFPDAICEGCAGDLTVSYEFAQRCEASDRALRCLGLLQATCSEPLDTKPEDIKREFEHIGQDLPELEQPAHDRCSISNDTYYCDNQCQDELTDTNLDQNYDYIKNPKKYKSKKNSRRLPDQLRTRRLRVKTGPLECLICKRTVACQSALELHMRTHTKEKPFTCDICQKSYSNKYTLKKHILRHYGKSFERSNRNKLSKESDKRRNRSKIGPLQCFTCGLMIPSQSAMENHMRVHTGEKPFSCDLCGARYKLKGTLKRHMSCSHPETHPDSKYTCEHCGKTFHCRSSIILHLRVHTGARPYPCSFCHQRFKQMSSLIRHKRRHTGERPYTCEKCGSSFLDRSLLNKHHSVHITEKKYVCHICDKAFKTKYSVKVHIEGHDKSKFWVCSICGMTFTFKGNMKTHMMRKHSERSGMCTVCNKEFGDVSAHMRVHTGEKPFICNICDRRYGSARSLAHHTGFKHRNTDKYKCTIDQCGAGFPTAPMLEFHILKKHSRSKPYVCEHCARGFLRASDLSRHLKLNHMDTQTRLKSKFIKLVDLPDS